MHVNAWHRLRRDCEQCVYRPGFFHWRIGEQGCVLNTSRSQRALSFRTASRNQVLELDPNQKNCNCDDPDSCAPILSNSSSNADILSFLEASINDAHHDILWFVYGNR